MDEHICPRRPEMLVNGVCELIFAHDQIIKLWGRGLVKNDEKYLPMYALGSIFF